MSTLFVPTRRGAGAIAELSQVAWATHAHAYTGAGYDFRKYTVPGDDVAAILRALWSDDSELRLEAHQAVISTLWHQGTVYEATAHAVPFLAAFVAEPSMPGRGRALASLVLIAASAMRGDDVSARQVIGAFHVAEAWLREAARAGPPLAQRAVDAVLGMAAGDVAALDASDDIAGDLEEWGDDSDPPG